MLDGLARLLISPLFEHPLLIIGAGRSGTSVLRQALGRHPRIYALPGEAPLITSVGGVIFDLECAENRAYYRDSLKLPKEYLFSEMRRLAFEFAAGPNFGFRRVLKGLMGAADNPLGRRFWCAKTFPSEQVALGLIALYPNIRFIYIVRNGCDVIQSRMKFEGFRRHEFQTQCITWANSVEKNRYLTKLPQCCVVRHEALVKDPGSFFSQLFSCLRIPDHPEPARYAETTLVHPLDQPTVSGTDVRQAHFLREPSYVRWTDEQKASFREICGSSMKELGYDIPF